MEVEKGSRLCFNLAVLSLISLSISCKKSTVCVSLEDEQLESFLRFENKNLVTKSF